MEKNLDTKNDFLFQCIHLLEMMNFLMKDMNKRKMKVYNYQYWEFIFNIVKKQYSMIRTNAIKELNSNHNKNTQIEIESTFAELEDVYERTATIFLEKKLYLEKHTTYFDLSKHTLSFQAQARIYRLLFKELGIKAIKTRLKKDLD